jgi:glucosyl-3-phosphoglycerate synthase
VSLVKVPERTLTRRRATISVVIPAHNEQETIGAVIESAYQGLKLLDSPGEVIVSASACTDNTAKLATEAHAEVVDAPIGKGAAILAGVNAASGDIICLIDGDLQYYGEQPLVTILVDPILHGIADACIANLYWRPIYPDQWLHGFFAPLAGHLFPELLPKAGSTPWSGQRAAERPLWPPSLPDGFTVDLALVLHWNDHARMLRPVLTDDWFNPIRPKPELLAQDYNLLIDYAIKRGRLHQDARPNLNQWFHFVEQLINAYNHDVDDPSAYEKHLLESSIGKLHEQMLGPDISGRC